MNNSAALAPVIQATGLKIGYKEEVVVPDISFYLAPHQSLALVGTNGSGKSTLLKTIVGLLPKISGEISVKGLPPEQAIRQTAYLSQFHSNGFILPLCTVDVVRMGRYADHGLMGKLVSEDLDLIHEAMKRMDIEALSEKPLRSLSGGQQQRVYIAQALARRADVLILDEPTAGLDAGAREIYQQAVRDELCRGAGVVIATHDIQEALDCTQAMLLAHKVIAYGCGKDVITTQALLETFGITINLGTAPLGVTVLEREHGHDHPCG